MFLTTKATVSPVRTVMAPGTNRITSVALMAIVRSALAGPALAGLTPKPAAVPPLASMSAAIPTASAKAAIAAR